jgi:hypothetical protein
MSPLWIMLQVKKGKFPALLDTGAQFSCVRSDVAEFLFHSGEPCSFLTCSVPCLLTDGKVSEVKDAVKLQVKILTYSWQHEFKILPVSPFPAILGLDFLQRTQMVIDVPSRKFNFRFAPDQYGTFVTGVSDVGRGEDFFQVLMSEALAMLSSPPNIAGVSDLSFVRQEYPRLFSSRLGTALCAPYEIDLVGRLILAALNLLFNLRFAEKLHYVYMYIYAYINVYVYIFRFKLSL